MAGHRNSRQQFYYCMLFGLGGLAIRAGGEAVVPAYLIGTVLAAAVGKDHALIRTLRPLTFGLLTPIYFICAGSFASLPAPCASPVAFLTLPGAKIGAKLIGVYPVTRRFAAPGGEAMYTTLLMSTGLTFGRI